jgi:hypothetical protein
MKYNDLIMIHVMANSCYPKAKIIYHLDEVEMESVPLGIPEKLGKKLLKKIDIYQLGGTFKVGRIEVITKDWWQFWRKI